MPPEILTPDEVDGLERAVLALPYGDGALLIDAGLFASLIRSHRALEKEVARLNDLLEEIRYDGMERLAPSENPNY